MFAAVCTTPPLTTAGNPQPTEPCHPASRTTSTAVPTIASGVAGFGVLILTLSSRSSPDSVSTGAPLIPDPPTSIPNTFMRPPGTDTPSFYTILPSHPRARHARYRQVSKLLASQSSLARRKHKADMLNC